MVANTCSPDPWTSSAYSRLTASSLLMLFDVRTSLLENMDVIPQLPPVAELPEMKEGRLFNMEIM
jgi:hypothetical protein